MIPILVVDDEPPTRERLRDLLARESDVRIVGECGTGREAVAAIHTFHPALVFLDIKMPELDGFGVIEAVEPGRLPGIVFVTAYERHAVRAFEVGAIDYLLKPILPARFAQALDRARLRLREPAATRELAVRTAVSQLLDPAGAFQVRTGSRVDLVPIAMVDWFEASGNYVRLHVQRRVHLIRDTIARLDASLEPNRYVRVHRRAIVRRDRIASLRATRHGEYDVVLHDGTEIRSGPTFTDRVRRLLQRVR